MTNEIAITTGRLTCKIGPEITTRVGAGVTATWDGESHSGTVVEVHDGYIVIECIL